MKISFDTLIFSGLNAIFSALAMPKEQLCI